MYTHFKDAVEQLRIVIDWDLQHLANESAKMQEDRAIFQRLFPDEDPAGHLKPLGDHSKTIFKDKRELDEFRTGVMPMCLFFYYVYHGCTGFPWMSISNFVVRLNQSLVLFARSDSDDFCHGGGSSPNFDAKYYEDPSNGFESLQEGFNGVIDNEQMRIFMARVLYKGVLDADTITKLQKQFMVFAFFAVPQLEVDVETTKSDMEKLLLTVKKSGVGDLFQETDCMLGDKRDDYPNILPSLVPVDFTKEMLELFLTKYIIGSD